MPFLRHRAAIQQQPYTNGSNAHRNPDDVGEISIE
jgi:hypothetical protein